MVSHDRAFLDAVSTRVWEIGDAGQLVVTHARYSDYLHAKMLAIEHQRRAFDEQQKRHTHLTATANKLKEATRAGEHYQGTDHDLMQRDFKRERASRSGRRAAAVERLRDGVEVVERVVDRKPLRLRLDPVAAGMDSAIIVDHAELGYGAGTADETALALPPVSLRIDMGERVAIFGYNGVG